MRKSAYWIGGIILFFGIWWNQPYFGWSYCVGEGAMRETDFVEEIRPLILRTLGTDHTHEVNRAFDLMKQCVAERGLKYCRYVGPDEAGSIITQQDPDRISDTEAYKYRYIVKEGGVGMYILPWGDKSGSSLSIMTYIPKSNFKSSRDSIGKYSMQGITKLLSMGVCSLGCDCNRDFGG